jgi:hypothetical protein
MKTKKFRNLLIASGMMLGGLIVFTGCDKDDDDVDNDYTVTGNASGSQMVPAVTGTGTATFTGTYDPDTRVLNYTTAWNGLTGAPTTAAFYNGATGVSGTIVGSPWTMSGGLTGTGTFTGSTTLTAAQAAQLTSGTWYYSYGTTANPTGEVRGQLTAVQ